MLADEPGAGLDPASPAPAIGAALRDRLALPLPGLVAQLRMAPQPRPGWDPFVVPDGLRDAAALVARLSARRPAGGCR